MTTETQLTDSNSPQAIFQKRLDAFEKVFGGKYLERFTDPVHFMNVEFYNYRMHKFYENNYAFISKNVFAEYVYRRRPKYNRDLLIRYHDLMARKLEGVSKLIKKYTDQIDHIMEANGGVMDEIGYVKQRLELTPIIHAQARQYLDLLLGADQLFTKVAAATLQGLIDGNSKTDIESKIILSFRAVGNTVRNEAVGLRKEAQRVREQMSKEDGINVDEELDTAITMQTSVVEEGTAVERQNTLMSGVAFPEPSAIKQYEADKEKAGVEA